MAKTKSKSKEVGYLDDMEYFLSKAKAFPKDISSLKQLKTLIDAEIVFRKNKEDDRVSKFLKDCGLEIR